MIMKDIILMALCASMCLASPLSGASEESTRNFIEHVLRIPNLDKVLNKVHGHLEQNKHQGLIARELISEEVDCDEPSEPLPEYTESLQTSRERELRHIGAPKHIPICQLERNVRGVTTEHGDTNEYEYRPASYEEVLCITNSMGEISGQNEICSSLGFSCVQWYKTIHLTRRRYSSNCWEAWTMVIPAGCECMWPVHKLGNMTLPV